MRPAALITVLVASVAGAEIDWTPTPEKFDFHPHFHTEPLIEVTPFHVLHKTDNTSQLAPGYIFFTLQTFIDGGRAWGPQIVDMDGNLVYYSIGDHAMAPQSPHVCDYKGQSGTHICASGVIDLVQGRWLTTKAFHSNDYSQAQEPYGATGSLSAPDGHEFSVVADGYYYLQPVYEPRTVDLRPFGSQEKGIILDACFQEVSVTSGQETFKWCYMDHFDVSETYIFLDVPANTMNLTSHLAGLGTEEKPWDAFHINSLDKNWENDYLVSIRHTNQVIKIAGRGNSKGFEAGHVLWQLGGKENDFKMLNNLTFSRQHHVRYIETSIDHTILSLFDNAWEGDNTPSSPYSAGKVIVLDHMTNEARLLKEYKNSNMNQSMAGGNMQALKNGNQFIGWGWQPRVTEFDADGNILYDATIANVNGVFSYRTRKYPWVAKPWWQPKLVAYSQTCDPHVSPLTAYVSWNGATEVRSWRFYVSVTDDIGPWILAGTFDKTGFETKVTLSTGRILSNLPLTRFVAAQALDEHGSIIGEQIAETFIPGDEDQLAVCSEEGCNKPYFDYTEQDSHVGECVMAPSALMVPAVISLILIFILIEGLNIMYDRFIKSVSSPEVYVRYSAV